MGMGGTAVSAFTTVQLATRYGRAFPFVLVAVVLAVYGAGGGAAAARRPGAHDSERLVPRPARWATLRMRATLQLSALYAVGFGGFVAFSVYLPTYLKNAYGLTQADAALRTAGFVVLAVLMRPVGGWLSDRFHPVPVLTVCFAAAAALAVLAAARLNLLPAGTVAFLGLAAVLGAASGACFALVARVAPAEKVGGVTGVVGAAGGLGGFVPPLVMGALYGAHRQLRHRPAATGAGRAGRRGLHLAGPSPRSPDVRKKRRTPVTHSHHTRNGSPNGTPHLTATSPRRCCGPAASCSRPRCRPTCGRCTRSAAATPTPSTGTAGATTRSSAPPTASTAPARARGRSTSRTGSSPGRPSRPTTRRRGRTGPSTSPAAAPAAPRSPGTPTPPPACATPTSGARCCRCTGRRRPGTATRWRPGRRSWRTPSRRGSTSPSAGTAGWCAPPGRRSSRWWRRRTCTRSSVRAGPGRGLLPHPGHVDGQRTPPVPGSSR